MTKIDLDLVTVLIPNLNGMPYLENALKSCLMQTYRCDILIVDNGSTDDSVEFLQAITKSSSRIQVMYQPIVGISGALNSGLKNIRTKYVARLDADDEMVEDRIMLQVAYLEKNPECAVVGTQLIYIDSLGHEIGKSQYPTHHSDVMRALSYSNPIAHPSVMFRLENVSKVGLYRPEFDGAEDLDLWIRCTESGHVENLPGFLTRYRQHEKQISRSKKSLISEIRIRTSKVAPPISQSSFQGRYALLNILKLAELLSRYLLWKTRFRFPRNLKLLIYKYVK